MTKNKQSFPSDDGKQSFFTSKMLLIGLFAVLLVLGTFLVRLQTQTNSSINPDAASRQNFTASPTDSQPINSYTKNLFINNNEINIEVADTDESRRQGLSGRKSMPQDAGMLFIFDKVDYYSFWMPDTYFPLDFIWINGDTIVDITENVPNSPGSDTQGLPRYKPAQPADKILELNAGAVKSLGIKIGDQIKI